MTRTLALAAIIAGVLSAPASAVAPPSAAATVNSNGTLAHGIGVAGASHLATGLYLVGFSDGSIPALCAYTASVGAAPGDEIGPNLANVQVGTITGSIFVRTYSAKTRAPADLPFNVYVAC